MSDTMVIEKPVYTPRYWFWLADDGRLFSSKIEALVTTDDPDYVAWTQQYGGMPTAWPRDLAGNQTNAALDDVLSEYGLSTAGALSSHTQRELKSGLNGVCETSVGVVPIDDHTRLLLQEARAANATKTVVRLVDGRLVSLDANQLAEVSDRVRARVAGLMLAALDAQTKIASGAITTNKQIDDIFGAVT
jgi:hypothetical protein